MLDLKCFEIINSNRGDERMNQRRGFWQRYFAVALWKKVLVGFVLGILVGAIVGPKIVAIQSVGTLFVNLLSMLVIPLIIPTLIVGIVSLKEVKKLGSIAWKTLVYFAATSIIAAFLGILLVIVTKTGSSMHLTPAAGYVFTQKSASFGDFIVGLIPTNIISAAASGNMLQLICFSIIFSLGLLAIGDNSKSVVDVLNGIANASMKILMAIMELAPYGIFALIAVIVGNLGIKSMLPLLSYIFCEYAGFVILLFVIYPLAMLLVHYKPKRFLTGIWEIFLFAFTGRSSMAALPLNMEVTERRLGVSKRVVGFVEPLGTTIHKDGAVLGYAVTVMFVAAAYGIHLSVASMISAVLVVMASSIAAAAVPSVGVIIIPLMLASVGLPPAGVALAVSVDVIMDMGATPINCLGNTSAAVVVGQLEGEITGTVAAAEFKGEIAAS